MDKFKRSLVWLRRDLRLEDNHALFAALRESTKVDLAFVFDKNILSKLSAEDKRVTFIVESLEAINEQLEKYKSSINIIYGTPETDIINFCKKNSIEAVFCNEDYEPYAIKRDNLVKSKLKNHDIDFYSFKDQVLFSPLEVLKDDKTAYKVFTAYKNKWKQKFYAEYLGIVPNYKSNLLKDKVVEVKKCKNIYKMIGFIKQDIILKGGRRPCLKLMNNFKSKISDYHKNRDFPYMDGTSYLSTYLRFGNISIREVISYYSKLDVGVESWINELIWREFFQCILYHYPDSEKKCFYKKYEQIKWPGTTKMLSLWKSGQTGYPIIDSAMRCLNETGLMPNRLRMVTASFLCKTLLIDWRKGEKYFAEKLLDYDLSANIGNWQWCSSTGVDSCPYFRIFNPMTQSKKFDKEGVFIKKYLPELENVSSKFIHEPWKLDMLRLAEFNLNLDKDYTYPIVDYAQKRQEALSLYSGCR